MKTLTRSIACVAGLMVAMSVAAAATFFASIEDLPLPDGFVEVEAEGVVFESPGGRIVTAVARGPGSVSDVRSFYRRALPPLGWQPRTGDRYRREDEQLSFSFERAGASVVVRVRLVPGEGEK